MAENTFPSAEELKKDVANFKEVCERVEHLTYEINLKGADTEKLQGEIDLYSKQQSDIIERFLNLSDDKELKAKIDRVFKKLENYSVKLESLDNEKEINKLKDEIVECINEWTSLIEAMILGVFENAKK